MTTERNMSSVLAKLMHIDKPSISHATHQRRHRVLSENYLQNIASVTKREKVLPLSDGSDLEMNVSEDFLCRTKNSIHARRSFSPSSSSSVNQKRRNSFSKQSKGMLGQEKRLSSSCNGMQSPIRSSVSSKEIAKQITGQVKNSIWHSCAESLSSRPRSEKSSEKEEEERITSFTCSIESAKKDKAPSFSSLKGSNSTGTQKAENQLSERWRMRNCSEEVRNSCGSKIRDAVFVTCSRSTSTTNASYGSINGCQVLSARYLSKPALFPSAWVPRSRARHLTLDKSWSLRPGKRVSKQCIDSKEESKEVQSTPQSCICELDLEKPSSHQEASSILDDLVKLAKQNLCEETSTPSRSLSNKSEFHEAQIVLDENGSNDLEKDDSQDCAVESLPSNCNLALLSLETEEVTDEGKVKMNMSTRFRRKNLSEDEDSYKYQLKHKDNVCEPRSPVSSLEGPEDHSHSLNLMVQVAEYLSVSDCFQNDAQGLQKKLQLIETVSLESRSEGPEMMVSSDEGDDVSSVRLYQNDPQIIEICQTLVQECWDFSYVVDVMVESGLETRNLEIESNTLHLQDYVINPLVFDSLEKKYGKSMPWEKSERRLLFDRLSSQLLEIVKPCVGLNMWRQPVAKRFSPRARCQELGEELWSMLVKQQQELKRESSDKVCRREIEWLDLEEDTNLIVQELESLVLDEVVEEFVSLEISCF